MKFIKRFRATKTWSILYLVFAICLIPLLLVAEWFLCIANAYPEFDLEMFIFDPVHTKQYLSWLQIVFNFDNVMAEIPYDLMVSLFLTGVFLLLLNQESDGGKISLQGMNKKELIRGLTRSNKGIYFLAVSLGIFVVSWLGSSGLFGYQEVGADGRALFFTGLDEYEFTSFLLPMLLFFAGFGAVGILALVNLLGLKPKPRKNAFIFIALSLLLFSTYFLFSPIHFELFVFQTFAERMLKLWVIVLFSTFHVITDHLKKIRNSREFLDDSMKGRKIKLGPLVPLVTISWVAILSIFFTVVAHVILNELSLTAEPGIFFMSTFNIVFSTSLTIGLYHFMKKLFTFSKQPAKEVLQNA